MGVGYTQIPLGIVRQTKQAPPPLAPSPPPPPPPIPWPPPPGSPCSEIVWAQLAAGKIEAAKHENQRSQLSPFGWRFCTISDSIFVGSVFSWGPRLRGGFSTGKCTWSVQWSTSPGAPLGDGVEMLTHIYNVDSLQHVEYTYSTPMECQYGRITYILWKP